jgi:lactate dehydrogenase-like 2-hydroxyacid dehydrogenase
MTKPPALLLFEPAEVPGPLRERLAELVDATWLPKGLDEITRDSPAAHVELLATANQDLDADALDLFPRLHFIVTTGTAYDYVDLEHCRDRGISVSNTPSYTGPAVAEHAMALLLASCRRVSTLDAMARAESPVFDAEYGVELAGKTAGIIGFGGIGQRVAKFLQAFNVAVVYVNRSRREFAGATQVEFGELLSQADFIFLTVPLTGETYHLLDAAKFRQLKRNCVIVNVSSDELIAPSALAEALCDGSIGGAALDVVGSLAPYRSMPRLVMTPGRGWYTAECIFRRAEAWIDTIATYLLGMPRNVVS